MLLPTKHLPLDRSVLGAAAIVLREFGEDPTVSELWDSVLAAGVPTFDLYVSALDLLFLLGLLDHTDGRLIRR
jgi:hypothetical protein